MSSLGVVDLPGFRGSERAEAEQNCSFCVSIFAVPKASDRFVFETSLAKGHTTTTRTSS